MYGNAWASVWKNGGIWESNWISLGAPGLLATRQCPQQTRPHTHPGPEAWYHAAGGVCLETPEDKAFGRAGDNGFIVPGDRPMRLTVTGKEERRSIVLILHETGKPASSLDTKWAPKGLCRD